ncbi:Hypothetical_protein [Hexamita inflata]|uniref:Hypothetical_protein n=1 Tax=Hexamita inflata TaxID=28002 RepID=A0AA86R038_9EUKA|nr:Hypothetical protein HINF_LOCUS52091 [Hexamita inflata]
MQSKTTKQILENNKWQKQSQQSPRNTKDQDFNSSTNSSTLNKSEKLHKDLCISDLDEESVCIAMFQKQQKQMLINIFNLEQKLNEKENVIQQIQEVLKHTKLQQTNIVDQIEELRNNLSLKSAEVIKLQKDDIQATQLILQQKQQIEQLNSKFVNELQTKVQNNNQQVANQAQNNYQCEQAPQIIINSSINQDNEIQQLNTKILDLQTQLSDFQLIKEIDERHEREAQFIREQMKAIMKMDTTGYTSELQRQLLNTKEQIINCNKVEQNLQLQIEKQNKQLITLNFNNQNFEKQILESEKKLQWIEQLNQKLEQQFASNEVLHMSDQIEISEYKQRIDEMKNEHKSNIKKIQQDNYAVIENLNKELQKFAGIEATHQQRLEEQRQLQKNVIDQIQVANINEIKELNGKYKQLLAKMIAKESIGIQEIMKKTNGIVETEREIESNIAKIQNIQRELKKQVKQQ